MQVVVCLCRMFSACRLSTHTCPFLENDAYVDKFDVSLASTVEFSPCFIIHFSRIVAIQSAAIQAADLLLDDVSWLSPRQGSGLGRDMDAICFL
jgi:hypothetical protein